MNSCIKAPLVVTCIFPHKLNFHAIYSYLGAKSTGSVNDEREGRAVAVAL